MRATVVFGFTFAFVSFVACSSADIESGFKNGHCASDTECAGGNVCRGGVCVPGASGGAASSGGAVSSGGAAASGGQNTASGGQVSTSGGASGGGGVSTGGFVATGGDPGSGGASGTGGAPGSGGHSETGGAGPDGGDGGSLGTGGASSTGGASTGGASTGGASGTGVFCNSRYCPEEQICCLGVTSAAGAFACTAGSCSNMELEIECSANRDCNSGTKCCQLQGGRRVFACQQQCPAAEIQCTGPNVCNSGQVCCETTSTSSGTETPVVTKCQSSCKGQNGSGEYILCHSNDDCPDRLPICAASNLLPGFKRCWGSFGGGQ